MNLLNFMISKQRLSPLRGPGNLNIQIHTHSARFVHGNDIITRIPVIGYKHIEALKYFNNNGRLFEDAAAAEQIASIGNIALEESLRDHKIETYLEFTYRQLYGRSSECVQ